MDAQTALSMLTTTHRTPDSPPFLAAYQDERWAAIEALEAVVCAASTTGNPYARGDTNWMALSEWLSMHEFAPDDTIESLAAAWDAGIMW